MTVAKDTQNQAPTNSTLYLTISGNNQWQIVQDEPDMGKKEFHTRSGKTLKERRYSGKTKDLLPYIQAEMPCPDDKSAHAKVELQVTPPESGNEYSIQMGITVYSHASDALCA